MEVEKKRVRRSYATPLARELPVIPEPLLLEVINCLLPLTDAEGSNSTRVLQRMVSLCFILSAVNSSWRRVAEAVCGQFLGEDFQQAARMVSPGFSALRAAAGLHHWREEPATVILEPSLVAGLAAQKLGGPWAKRFSFRTASKILRWKSVPEYSDDEPDSGYDEKLDAYSADDGPIVKPGCEFGGFGKVTHEVSVALSRNGQLMELDASMCYEVDCGNVFDYCEVSVTFRGSRRMYGKTSSAESRRKKWLQWGESEDEVQDESMDESVAPCACAFFERESVEDAASDLVALLKSVFQGVRGPCCYAPSWSHLLAKSIETVAHGGSSTAAPEGSEDFGAEESEDFSSEDDEN